MVTLPPDLPSSLAKIARKVRTDGGVPLLLVHPDWERPAPMAVWLHGRTAFKELDPGRYTRWIRAGVGVCAVDLPNHGERADARDPRAKQGSAHSMETIAQAVGEIDGVVERALAEGPFDRERLGIGGMSLGGMVTLRRLCDEHPFRAAAVEATTGSLTDLYVPAEGGDVAPELRRHAPDVVGPLDPSRHLEGWRPIPLLAVHSEADEIVPWAGQRAFLDRLGEHYAGRSAGAGPIERMIFEKTGAPREHLGFGEFGNDAKNRQAAFFAEHLGG